MSRLDPAGRSLATQDPGSYTPSTSSIVRRAPTGGERPSWPRGDQRSVLLMTTVTTSWSHAQIRTPISLWQNFRFMRMFIEIFRIVETREIGFALPNCRLGGIEIGFVLPNCRLGRTADGFAFAKFPARRPRDRVRRHENDGPEIGFALPNSRLGGIEIGFALPNSRLDGREAGFVSQNCRLGRREAGFVS